MITLYIYILRKCISFEEIKQKLVIGFFETGFEVAFSFAFLKGIGWVRGEGRMVRVEYL